MRELLRTNNLVLLSFVEATLRGAGIAFEVWDRHTSAVEGSIGIFPRRVLVSEADWRPAVNVLTDAGLAHELTTDAATDGKAAKQSGDPVEASSRRWVWPWQRA
jgi:hypothetical protein